jgi:hypothetical protein
MEIQVSRAITKLVFGLVAICIIVVAIVAFQFTRSTEQSPARTRESAIPEGAIKMTPEADVLPSILHSTEWMTPIPLSSAINTAGGEDSPFVMPDGNTLYFFFTPNVSVPAEKQLLDGVTGIWVSRKQNNTWSKAERIVLQDSGKLALDGAEFVQGDTMVCFGS